jgi:hypothetical protein
MPDAPPATLDRHHPVPTQDVAGRRTPGQGPARMPLMQQSQELLTAPGRVSTPRLQDRLHDLIGCLIRRAPRAPRAFLQARGAVAQVAVDPLVAGLAADAVQCAQLRNRQGVAKEVGDELGSLVHG